MYTKQIDHTTYTIPSVLQSLLHRRSDQFGNIVINIFPYVVVGRLRGYCFCLLFLDPHVTFKTNNKVPDNYDTLQMEVSLDQCNY